MANCDRYRARGCQLNYLGRIFIEGIPARKMHAIDKDLLAPEPEDCIDIPRFFDLMLGPETIAHAFLQFVPVEFLRPLCKKYARFVRMSRKIFCEQNNCQQIIQRYIALEKHTRMLSYAHDYDVRKPIYLPSGYSQMDTSMSALRFPARGICWLCESNSLAGHRALHILKDMAKWKCMEN